MPGSTSCRSRPAGTRAGTRAGRFRRRRCCSSRSSRSSAASRGSRSAQRQHRVFDYRASMARAGRSRRRSSTTDTNASAPRGTTRPAAARTRGFSTTRPREAYQEWLELAIRRTLERPGSDRLVFLNAWNEWAEGAHLEPDQQHGLAYLEATKRALERAAADRRRVDEGAPMTSGHLGAVHRS